MLWKVEWPFIHNHETARDFLMLKSCLISNLIRLSHIHMGSPYADRLPIWVCTYGTGPYIYGQKYSYGTEQ